MGPFHPGFHLPIYGEAEKRALRKLFSTIQNIIEFHTVLTYPIRVIIDAYGNHYLRYKRLFMGHRNLGCMHLNTLLSLTEVHERPIIDGRAKSAWSWSRFKVTEWK